MAFPRVDLEVRSCLVAQRVRSLGWLDVPCRSCEVCEVAVEALNTVTRLCRSWVTLYAFSG